MSGIEASSTIGTSTGTLVGTQVDGIRRFLSIPYAVPPFGDLRFALPAPPTPWEEPRDASAFGATAPQHPYFGPMAELLGSVEIPGEDILTLNVWSPADPPPGGLPVMVWYHGGALERGTTAMPIYDGTTFARDGVVFVSVNYRIGSEGFSVLEGAPRNLGLADAAAGLQWVHDEIAAFGGDPARVTIVGESAGGAIVAALLVRPDSAPLIAGAIIESGPLDAVTPERAGKVTRELAKRLGVPPTRDAFLALTPTALLEARKAHAAGSSPLGGAPGFMLAIDPDTLPVSPHEGLIDVRAPLIIGTNTDEYRLWFPPDALASITPAKLLIARIAMKIPGRTVAAYRADQPEASTGEIFGQLATDLLLRASGIRAARRRTAPTYVYEFTWPSPVRGLRAAHAMEIGFVFDHLGAETSAMAGPDAPQSLADRMHGDWVRFISTGDPGWEAFGRPETVRIYDIETGAAPLPRAAALDALLSTR